MAKKNPDLMSSAPASQQSSPVSGSPRRRGGRGRFILFLALVAVSAYAYCLYQQNLDLKDPARQIARVVAGVSNHIIVPEGETPGVFAIDKEKNTEPFFQNAETGDWLAVYRSTNQALIWSPRRNILVNAGVLVVNPEEQQVSETGAEEAATGTEE